MDDNNIAALVKRMEEWESSGDKVAVYLVTHGTLSRPRLVEIQHSRIKRHIGRLGITIKEETIDSPLLPPYVDVPNSRSYVDCRKLPALQRLVDDYTSRQMFRAVIVDLWDGPSEYLAHQVKNTLNYAHIPFINVAGDGEELINSLQLPYRIHPEPFTDEDDFFAFYPALAADLLNHLEDQADTLKKLDPSFNFKDKDYLSYFRERFSIERPYSSGRRPFWSKVTDIIESLMRSRPEQGTRKTGIKKKKA